MIIFTGLGSLSVEELQVSLHKHIADLSGQTSMLLPVPVFTLISGGKHAGNNLAIQVNLQSNVLLPRILRPVQMIAHKFFIVVVTHYL